jgi:hypothetical protein
MAADATTIALLANYLGGLPQQDNFLLGNSGANVFTGYGQMVQSFSDDYYYYWTNELIKGISNNGPGNVNQTFDSLAASMTANMRTECGERAVGTVRAPEPFIHARWGFMLLPTTMVLTGFALRYINELAESCVQLTRLGRKCSCECGVCWWSCV